MAGDISSSSGIAITAKTLANIVTENNRELACRTLLRYTAKLLQELKIDAIDDELDDFDRRVKRSSAKLMLCHFESLSIESTVDDIREMLVNMTPIVENGIDSCVANSEEALDILRELIGVLFPKAPRPVETLCIGAPRYQCNWDLPPGEALFVFAEDECFVRVKTEAGKELDSMLGVTTKLDTWTNYG